MGFASFDLIGYVYCYPTSFDCFYALIGSLYLTLLLSLCLSMILDLFVIIFCLMFSLFINQLRLF